MADEPPNPVDAADLEVTSISGSSTIRVTLPDGKMREEKNWSTTRPLEDEMRSCAFEDDDEGRRYTFRHSSAHVPRKEKQPFERIEVLREQVLEIFSKNQFKVEIIIDLPEDRTISVYRCGPLVYLCIGPDIPNRSIVKAFRCLKASSPYMRGGRDRESLQRVIEISYPDSKRVKEKQPFECIEVSRQQELEMFFDNQFKGYQVDIIRDLPEDKTITVYRSDPSVDLCCSPHMPSTSIVKAFCCLKADFATYH